MKLLILEGNLIWSSRLASVARGLGHEVFVATRLPDIFEADVAIVNLGELDAAVVAALQAAGTKVIGHAGHKESQRLEFGREAGCDLIATNSEIHHKLPAILAAFESRLS